MSFIRRAGGLSLALALALAFGSAVSAQQAPASGASAGPAPDVQVAPKKWSDDIWASAVHRDRDALERRLQALPENASDAEAAARFRDSLKMRDANIVQARAKRDEARAKALTEMREYITSNDLSKALRAAVTVQTLSDDMESAFADPDVLKIIKWAQERIPQVEAELDWLLAQELLFYLRTLYDDTSKFAEYKQYHDELDAVNRRVQLLAQYAPRRLHDLRARRAERLGEKPLGEFRPGEAGKWEERIAGIKPDMLKAALKTAASEHIEAAGWRPLLRGGLTELRLLSTTATLDETFPKLGDPNAVATWVAFVDAQLAKIKDANDADLNSWTMSGMIDDLLRTNKETIDLPPPVIYREFGDGALDELDEFSEIVWPDKLPRFKQATEGAFVGVGILIRHNETQEILVVNPLEGTPAYFGGVKPNDKISEVDGESTVGWTLNDAVDRITGEEATLVKLGLQREGVDGLVPITLKRDVIKLRSVLGWWKKTLRPDGSPEWDWYIDPVDRIAYVKLTQFTDDTYNDLLDAWREITANGKPAGLILDLRYNPGGLLTSAVSISNLFVKDGLIVSGEDKDGHPAWAPQKADPTRAKFDGVPTVVLINQGSASASEIVSGCLQAHNNSAPVVVVGERSFGKGSVQTVHPISPTSRLKLTTQYYRLPPNVEQCEKGEQGSLVHKRIGAKKWGVDPDVLVKMTPQQATDALELRQAADVIPQDEKGVLQPDSPKRPDIKRLITEGMDPQLETALLILQARAMGDTSGETRHASTNH